MGQISDWYVDTSELAVSSLDYIAAYEELLPCFDLLDKNGNMPDGWSLTKDLRKAHYLVDADGYDEYTAKPDEYEWVTSWFGLFGDNIVLIRRSLSKLLGIENLEEKITPATLELTRRLNYRLSGFADSIVESLHEKVVKFLVLDALAGLQSKLAMDVRQCLNAGAIPCGLEIVSDKLVFQAYMVNTRERYLDKLFSDAKNSSDLTIATFASSVELQSQMGVELDSAVDQEGLELFKKELKKVRESKPNLLVKGWGTCSPTDAVEWLQNKLIRRPEVELYQGYLRDLSSATSIINTIDNDCGENLALSCKREFIRYLVGYSMKVKHRDLKFLALFGLSVVGSAILAGTKIPYVEEMQKVYLAGFIPAGFEVRDGKVIYLACPIEEE